MTFVRTFENVKPPRRDDTVPFTIVEIRENAIKTLSTATLIDTKSLVPLDPSPFNPLPRTFTSTASLIENGWYWLTWKDAAANQAVVGPFQLDYEEIVLTDFEKLIRSEIPQTWDGLARDTYVGVDVLRHRIQNVKSMYLPNAIVYNDPSGLTAIMQAYISKRCALDLIPTGIEYWMRQKISLSSTGTNENTTYADPVAALREAAKRLQIDVERMSASPDILVNAPSRGDAPGITFGGDPITSNPYEWQPAFDSDETIGQERTA